MTFVGTQNKWLLWMVKDLVHKNFRRFHMKKESDLVTPKEGIWKGHEEEGRKHF